MKWMRGLRNLGRVVASVTVIIGVICVVAVTASQVIP